MALEYQALRGTGLLSRVATAWLCRRVVSGKAVRNIADRNTFVSVGRIACSAGSDWARGRALRAFGKWSDDDRPFQQLVLFGLMEASEGTESC